MQHFNAGVTVCLLQPVTSLVLITLILKTSINMRFLIMKAWVKFEVELIKMCHLYEITVFPSMHLKSVLFMISRLHITICYGSSAVVQQKGKK